MTQNVDTLFTNAIVLTMDGKLNQYDPGAVAVKGDSIVAVGPEAEIVKEYSANEIIDSVSYTHLTLPTSDLV